MARISINGQFVEAQDGTGLLTVVRANGIKMPSLCLHPALSPPSGTCRLCAAEITPPSGHPKVKLACATKVKPDLVVVTESESVHQARQQAFARLLQMAPHSAKIRALARQWGIDPGPEPDGCIRCRLCIRVCKEVVRAGALTMDKREGVPYVAPISGRCIGCGTCANLCPTGAITLTDADGIRTIMIRDEVIGRHPLQRCEGCGCYFATPKFLDHVHQHSAPHPETKQIHCYCPTCAKLFSSRVQALSAHVQR